MSGFEVNRFVGLSERKEKHLICSIYLNVFRNAIRSDCEHTFCKQCVEDWIKTNKDDCPECRKAFIKRERNLSTSYDENTLIVCDYVFRTNLMANNLINDLKIKYDFESKGCKEVIELGLLSSHLKECEHRLCEDCGLTFLNRVRRDGEQEHDMLKCFGTRIRQFNLRRIQFETFENLKN